MEKPAKLRSKIFSLLPKVGSITFQNPPFSPGRDKMKANIGKGFSGPIISIIPSEARTKSKNGSFHSHEPTSPKVSCIGQIKQKKKICNLKREPKNLSIPGDEKKKMTSSSSAIRNLFNHGRKSDVSARKKHIPVTTTPSLGKMKQFSSGRGALSDFDWKAHGGSEFGRNYHSDEEREKSDEEDEVIIPFSAPILVGGGIMAPEPRKEVNLWKRRTMDPPRPLRLIK